MSGRDWLVAALTKRSFMGMYFSAQQSESEMGRGSVWGWGWGRVLWRVLRMLSSLGPSTTRSEHKRTSVPIS